MIEISTEHLTLRLFREADLPAFVAYRSDPEVARYQSWEPGFSMFCAELFLESQRGLKLGDPGQWLQLLIVERSSDIALGDCAVCFQADQPATAEIGITLARSSQNRGVATEALTALLAALFQEHGVHRVIAHADDRNTAVQRLLERLGFRLEARLAEADWFKGAWSTLLSYAMLDHEHAAQQRVAS